MSKLSRILAKGGVMGLAERGASYAYKRAVRRFLPVVSPVRYSGIPIGVDRRFGDRLLPSIARLYQDVPRYEETLVAGLKTHLRPGDRVVVVGGGWGVTATIAALEVGPQGHVTCFEGNAAGCETIRITAERNGVSDRLAVVHAVVGEAIRVYGSATADTIVPPESVPECDLLQLDCEGAELAIIRGMSIRPRVVLVETHGLFGAPTGVIGECLEERAYETTHMGAAEPLLASFCDEHDIQVIAGVRRA